MDATEKHVHDYLVHRGFANITYEPDGNVPPDFLVNGNIAIEVRRLNQNYFDVGGAKGLEEDAIPLWHKIKQLLSDPGPPVRGESWFVHFRFSRPLQPWKTVEPTLLAGLQSFMASAMHERKVVARLPRFELEVSCRASEAHETMFLLGGCSDQESGGWLLAEMETNTKSSRPRQNRPRKQSPHRGRKHKRPPLKSRAA